MWGSREESCHHPPLCHVHFRHRLGLQWLRMASGAWASCSVGSPTGSPFEDRNPLGESGLNVRGSAAGTVISFAVALSLSETQGFCPVIYPLILIISRSLLTWILGFAWSEQVLEVALNSAFVFRHFYKVPYSVVIYSSAGNTRFFCRMNLRFYLQFSVDWAQDFLRVWAYGATR